VSIREGQFQNVLVKGATITVEYNSLITLLDTTTAVRDFLIWGAGSIQ
jgi:hypothetical protein